LSVIHPPRIGPTIGATITPTPKSAMAMPCSFTGKVSSKIACDKGCMPPPPKPCKTRKNIKLERFQALPQKKELMVKSETENRRYFLRPKNRASHPVIGITIAFDTR